MSETDPALVFLKRNIQLPMQPILDAPVAARSFREASRREVFAEDVIANFRAVLSLALRIANDGADRLQVGPTSPIRQVLGNRTDQVGRKQDRKRHE